MRLLKLDKPFLSFLFVDWISLSDFCLLDNAFCNSKQRSKFMEIVVNKLCIKDLIDSGNIQLWKWLISRNLIISNLHWTSHQSSHSLVTSSCVTTNLHRLVLSRCDDISFQALLELLKLSPILTELVICISNQLCPSLAKQIANEAHQLINITMYKVENIGNKGLMQLIKKCKGLTRFHVLHSKSVTNKTIFELSKHSHYLTDLKLSWCDNISHHCNSSFVTLGSRLKYLSFLGNDFFRQSELFQSCSELLELQWSIPNGYIGFSDRGTYIGDACHKLTKLNLQNRAELPFEELHKIVSNCPHLQYMNLNECYQAANSDVIKALLINCSSLHTLLLAGCCQVQLCDLLCGEESGASCGKLKELDISCFICIFSDLQALLQRHSSTLTALNISRMVNVDNSVIELVVRTCPMLKHLNMSNCGINKRSAHYIVDSECISIIAEHGVRLDSLDISYCAFGVSDSSLRWLLQNCTFLREIIGIRLQRCEVNDNVTTEGTPWPVRCTHPVISVKCETEMKQKYKGLELSTAQEHMEYLNSDEYELCQVMLH